MELRIFEGVEKPVEKVFLRLLERGECVQLCIVDETGTRKYGGTLFEVVVEGDKLRGEKITGIHSDLPVALDDMGRILDF